MEYRGEVVAKDAHGHVLGGDDCNCDNKSIGGVNATMTVKSNKPACDNAVAGKCLEWVNSTMQESLDKQQFFSERTTTIDDVHISVRLNYGLLDNEDLQLQTFLAETLGVARQMLQQVVPLSPLPPTPPTRVPEPALKPAPATALEPAPAPAHEPKPKRRSSGPEPHMTRAAKRRQEEFNTVQTRRRKETPRK